VNVGDSSETIFGSTEFAVGRERTRWCLGLFF
jgi:hypothetical protein